MVRQPVLKLTLYQRDSLNDIYDTQGRVLGSVISASARLGIDTIKDVFNFRLPNTLVDADTNAWARYVTKSNQADNNVRIGDYIKIESYYDSPAADPDDNVIIVGQVTDFSYDNEEGTPILNVTGNNITENLLSGFTLVSKKVDDVDATVPEIVIEVMNRLNTANLAPQKRVFAALTTQPILFNGVNVTGTNGNVVATKSDGSAFPSRSYSKTWQPAYKMLEDLSTPEYTDDEDAGNYIFFIKSTPVLEEFIPLVGGPYINELVFQPASRTVDTVLNRGTDYLTSKISYDKDEVRNVLIVKPGTSSDGTGITTYVVNEPSLAEFGPKYGFYSKPELGNAVLKDVRSSGIGLGSTFSGYVPNDFAAGSPSWTFETIFTRADEFPYEETGTPVTVTDEDEYHSAIRTEITRRARIEAQRVVDDLGEPTFKCDLELVTGSNNIGMGTLVEVQEKTAGWIGTATDPNYKLRVRDIRHSWDDSGWNTTLVCVEDEKTISEKIN